MSGAVLPARAQTAAPDTTVGPVSPPGDSTATAVPDTVRAFSAEDTLGVPGTLKGETVSPAETKKVLQRMGSSEGAGRTEWERKKNPKVAMLCHTLLPGLGQVYNGRRLKVAVMAGFASYYYGTAYLNLKKWHAHEAARDRLEPGSDEFVFENQLAGFYEEEARTYLWWSGAVWLLGLIDSWIDAHLYDVRTYTPPRPPDAVVPAGANERTNYLTLGFTLERSK
jgi:hypothetical protein